MEEIIKEVVLITPEVLEKLGWSKKGNAWYGPNNKRMTNYEDQWQIWREGKSITVKYTFEL